MVEALEERVSQGLINRDDAIVGLREELGVLRAEKNSLRRRRWAFDKSKSIVKK